MPLLHEVEAQLASALDFERQNCARRVKREEAHAALVASSVAEQIHIANAAAEARVKKAREQADSIIAAAKVRLQSEAERQAAEFVAARARAEESSRQAAGRAAVAEAGLEAAKADAAARIAKAQQTSQDAVNAAEAVAADMGSLATARMAEAERREAETCGRALQQAAESEAREARRTELAEQRIRVLEEDAQSRSDVAKQSAMQAIDQHVGELRSWMLRAEKEWEATQERVALERRRAGHQTNSVKALADGFLSRGQQCLDTARNAEVFAKQSVEEAKKSHERWQTEELSWMADQVDGTNGLEDLARKLRSGLLMQAGSVG
ncbi:unnamed protein product [Polarella glacialis]|uniref:Uncharacterized protein n=1 Tax=Polarella glacialis TaxID=89957 RepID=A0A813FKQ9_POLGL|nr:unnamed protein product [Polarella glacialis]